MGYDDQNIESLSPFVCFLWNQSKDLKWMNEIRNSGEDAMYLLNLSI